MLKYEIKINIKKKQIPRNKDPIQIIAFLNPFLLNPFFTWQTTPSTRKHILVYITQL